MLGTGEVVGKTEDKMYKTCGIHNFREGYNKHLLSKALAYSDDSTESSGLEAEEDSRCEYLPCYGTIIRFFGGRILKTNVK